MALVIADRVKVTTTTTGTGTLSLASASTGFQDFSVVGDGNTTYYAVSSALGSEWEVGIGTYTASGTTLSRGTILGSSNSGSAVNFSAGTKDVYVVYPADKAVYKDASGNINEDITGNAATATVLETARTIAGQSFNGSANISIAPTDLTGVTASAAEINVLDGIPGTLTATELGYVDGVTSAIQTQLDAMVEKAGDTMTGFLTLHADPTSNLHAATKAYVDEVAQGVALKPAADAASTANISGTYNNGTAGVGATMTFAAAASFTVDGVTFDTVGQGLLLKDQTAAEENGRYYLSTVGDGGTSWVFTRCGYCDTADEIPGGYIFIQGGTANAGTGWVMTVADAETFVVGTDDITVIQFSGAGTYTAGTGLDLTGTVFSHTDTSSQASVNNSGNTFIQDVTLDDFGHVTALTSATAVINDGTLSMGVSGTGLSGSASFTANDSDNVTFTVTSNATSANTVSTIVARDASGNFSAGTITAALSGNASTATTLATARTIGGVSFNGSANIDLPGVNTAGNQSTSGNAATATAWATGRTLTLSGDVSGTSSTIDGTGNITLTATVADDSHNHTIANVDGLQTALDGKQPLDADLTAIAGLSSADGNFIVGSATGWVAESGATARTSLGLGSLATLSTVNAATITDNSVGAAELNVSGNGTSSQFLRSDGDGTFTWATPTDTNTTYSAGTALDLSGTTFNVDLSELTTSTADGDGDYFVVVDAVNAQKKLTKANINISGFNNDAGYTTNTGDITSVVAGSGLTGGATSGAATLNVGAGTGISVAADTVGLATAGAGAATYSSGISAIQVDAYGRVTSVTGSAGYTTNTGTVTSVAAGSYLTGGTITTSGTLAVDATSANTASKVVARDASGNFSAGTITATLSGNASTSSSCSGNAATATTLATARTINGVSFNGSANITVEPYISDDDTGDTNCPVTFTADSTAGYKRLYEDSAFYFDNTNNILYAGAFNATSDENLKKDIVVVEGALDKLFQLRGVEFKWKETDKLAAGVIAQDVQNVLPQAVFENANGHLSVQYDQLHAVLIEAVKELTARVKELEAKVG
jgi:hypothetical protein